MINKIKEAVEFIQTNYKFNPEIGIVLGTGLGGLVTEVDITYEISYSEIPNFPVSTVEGHSGKLLLGTLSGKKVIVMQGRFHFYEGYTMDQVVFPIRVMKLLGIKNLFLSNASGGVNPEFEIGDLMLITDHINMIPNPLIGKNINELGTRFPDMSEPYSSELLQKARSVANKMDIKVVEGIYLGTTGPTFETPAEYKYFRIVGADTVGMSTVPEVIAARQMQLPCFAVSIITDLGVPDKIEVVTHEEVQQVAKKAEVVMTNLFKELIKTV